MHRPLLASIKTGTPFNRACITNLQTGITMQSPSRLAAFTAVASALAVTLTIRAWAANSLLPSGSNASGRHGGASIGAGNRSRRPDLRGRAKI